MFPRLGVNVDHVATVRQARRAPYPDPVLAALLAEQAGAEQITVHLRMDRRHIQEKDLHRLRGSVQTVLNVEMAATVEMMNIAEEVGPDTVTLVAERAEEITTEGGLSLLAHRREVAWALERLGRAGIRPAVFIDPELEQIRACADLGAKVVELNTARYAEARFPSQVTEERKRLREAAEYGLTLEMEVAAGHGLHHHNVSGLLEWGLIAEYNIGHSLIARALFTGLEGAVRDMVALLRTGPSPRLPGQGV